MLETRSFDAVILGGRILHEENLQPLEGKEVQITLHYQAKSAETLEDLDIEKDIYLPMPVKQIPIRAAQIRDVGHAKPSLILPEGVENE